MSKKIKVLIVDDSQLIRHLLEEILSSDERIEVIGTATDPFDAREKIKQLNPDVLTLDVEMPRMDGITFLSNLMRLKPMPVIMISTLTEKGADITLQALELGAIDYIAKPKVKVNEALPTLSKEINAKIKLAAKANVQALERIFNREQFSSTVAVKAGQQRNQKIELIAIGASTGGTEAIKQVLMSMPTDMPPIVIVQHMPPGFTKSFAERLNKTTGISVRELTEQRLPLTAGHAYLANGDQHMVISEKQGQYFAGVEDSDPVNRHKPSVDVLFNSLAQHCSNNNVAILLTGMGIDGASGMKNMRDNGSLTIAQDENSCVVWGMPRAAVERDAAAEILPLEKIGQFLVNSCYK
ncbi:protein-glutamate methylesterase/protein-glutamine glutaminase [Oceanicoccus sagamiensis]|uniref:Protein-glutamate methylesterase/protein-glutamine glutaminase n=1 Tax=Oceanicoccus sagamiensis TaxID=716816 RepID=A0A1X9NAA3_9GAMM|nr:chemotaxis response regulator protein-glutamate methylesterase [Oceanicoccus sagamiensis]ARN74978.1 chemotaxis response regulator protein-glutamate methylesterase [Oceanicoccus sagamiensis]